MNLDPTTTLPAPEDSLVLIVDDVQQNIQVVGTMLRQAGYSIMPANNGTVALQRAQRKVPDLILLDLMMPDMDGLEVCRRLKADKATAHVPIIFLTASNEMSHLVQGFEAGAVDYVTKPFNPPELLARVRTHLELKHARDVILRYSQQLAHLNNEKNEFMGIVAHDLRSPLGVIKGYAEFLLEEPRMARAELEDCALRIRDTAQSMVDMVQQLLDANRIERGEVRMELAPCNPVAILSALAQGHRARAAAKQQVVQFDAAATSSAVLADQNFLVQVLDNLISNAIKYSPPGKRIHLRLLPSREITRFEVQDEGPGLSEEDQQRLFGKFARLSAKPTGGESATGLGLSIVKRLVDAMHGRVWCESQPGAGATFIVTLPSAAAPAATP